MCCKPGRLAGLSVRLRHPPKNKDALQSSYSLNLQKRTISASPVVSLSTVAPSRLPPTVLNLSSTDIMNAHVLPVCCVLKLGFLYFVQGGLRWLLVAYSTRGSPPSCRPAPARRTHEIRSGRAAHCYWTASGRTDQLSLGWRSKADFDQHRSAAAIARVGLLANLVLRRRERQGGALQSMHGGQDAISTLSVAAGGGCTMVG